jgi:hypothetical protein
MKFQLPILLERMGLIFMFCAYCDVRVSSFKVGVEIAHPRLDGAGRHGYASGDL